MPVSFDNNFVLKNILESFFENSFDAIVITEAAAGYKIVYANPRFCKMTGYMLEELIGQSPKILQGEATNKNIIERMRQHLIRGEAFHGAATNYRKNGDAYPVEWNITPVCDEQGHVSYFLSIQKDLSQLKGIVSQLKRTNQHFRQFLLDISQSIKSESTTEAARILEERQIELTDEMLENAQLYSPELREAENVELFGDTEFFDCDNDLHGMLVEPTSIEVISAADYCERLTYDIDVFQLEHLIDEVRNTISLLPYSSQQHEDMLHIAHEIQYIANEIFHFEDFVGISSALAELARQNIRNMEAVPSAMILEFYDAMFNDLHTWLKAIFIEKTAQNIHEYDASIISSAQQIRILLQQ